MNTSKMISLLILLLTIPSIVQWLNFDTNNLTAVWWSIDIFILFCFLKGKQNYYQNKQLPIFIKLFLVLVGVQSLHGLFRCQGYWDYKALIGNILIYLLPFCYYIFSNPRILAKTINVWLKYALLAFWLVLPIMQPEAPAKYLAPLMFLLLLIKPIPTRYKIVIFLYFLLIFIYGSLGARSSIIKYSIAFLFGIASYTKFYSFRNVIKCVHLTLFVLPIIIFILGITNVFNIFEFDKYLTQKEIFVVDTYDAKEKESLTADTRTFIYQEAITSAIKHNYIFLGNSLARGYESAAFAETDFYKRGERYDSEVSILNIFTHFGLMGVLSYFLIFVSSSYLAIYKSNNQYIKMIGLYVSFRWVFAWIEDFSRFDLNYLFLWIMIGMCYSVFFRNMSNKQFELWVKCIFKSNTYILKKLNSLQKHSIKLRR